MRNNIFLLFALIFCIIPIRVITQAVSIKGNDFYIDNTKFYPIAMNFSLTGVEDSNNNYFLSIDYGYGETNFYECNNTTDCSTQILEHFNYLTTIGFNTVRIVGIAPKYSSEIGLAFTFKPKTNPDSNPLTHMNPLDSTDFVMQTVLLFYEDVLKLAKEASLKVILLMKGDKTAVDHVEIELRKVFLETLASFLNNSEYNDALLAYDLFNEPAYHDTVYKTKQESCEIIKHGMTLLKATLLTSL